MRLSLAFCYRLHRRLGLLLIVPLLAISGSGLVLIFFDQLRYSAEPYALDEPVQTALPPIELIETIQRTKPDMRLIRLYLPSSNRQTARVLVQGDHEKLFAFLHPGTGKIIRIRAASEKDWLDKLYQFHQGKWLGTIGQFLFSLCGGAVFLLWLFGLRLYKAISGKKKSMCYHRRIGFTLGGFLAAFTLCGALLNYAAPLQRWLKPAPDAPLFTRPQTVLSIQELLAIAKNIYPASSLERVYIDHPTQGVVMARYQDSGRIYLDRQNGQILQLEKPLSHWLDWLYPLHSGRMFDIFRYPVLLLFGLSLLVLALSGVIPIWRRRQTSNRVYLPALRQKINIDNRRTLKKRRFR
ncbi:PepSY domain-containing protein [Methylomarinum sp. Ch1-1]|uniref:PepSY domain-containing protein n=1 Tax=Methylomarinum roseum TaxID=3067653 RepID=A0AAU7NZK1_9GAMM|nr:PepSY domain-containing protein [Methylomarinum sp. Ch1-1]MDP4521434.1 PepSY domain-containing protein [Methylomarinum sp. Ch1-1]